MKQIAYSCLALGLLYGTLVAVFLYLYIDSKTLYSNDYTLCSKSDSQTSCQSLVDNQMSVSNPVAQPCRCRLTFELDDVQNIDQINVYYGLDGFYQNYRFLTHSFDAAQLGGKTFEPRNPDICDSTTNNKTYIPCGGLANVMFDDEFTLYHGNTSLDMDKYNIPLEGSRHYQYSNHHDLAKLRQYSKPPRWSKGILDLDGNASNNGFENGPFIVWMTYSSFNNFIKLYSIIKPPRGTLAKGQYSLDIDYRYGVHSAGGRKSVHIETVGALGVRNIRLIFTLSALAAIYLATFIFTFLVWRRWAYRARGLFLVL